MAQLGALQGGGGKRALQGQNVEFSLRDRRYAVTAVADGEDGVARLYLLLRKFLWKKDQ